MSQPVSVFWFRRDLRLHDNAGLYHALRSGCPVLPLFIFDTHILNDLKDKHDKRVTFIHNALTAMHEDFKQHGSGLFVFHGTPAECFKELMANYHIGAVYTNHDYEPYASERDKRIADLLKTNGIAFHTYKDQVIFDKDEVVKDNGEPYTVFTPYSKRWKEKLSEFYLSSYPTEKYRGNFLQHSGHVPSLEKIGFKKTEPQVIAPHLDRKIASTYDKTRDYPAIYGTTRLSVHLRFGTISIRWLASQAKETNAILLNELIWREFYQMILWHFPHVVAHCFKREFDHIVWRNNEREFEQWCNGQTGYPVVDAGMRELNETGYMHNRVRMIVASFLTKDLLIDWRWGEAYFGQKLLDYDLAANNGGWQWCAGTGCDAAPYFRIFNPTLQTQKFDPDFKYIRKWLPEFEGFSYVKPIVDHSEARDRCLQAYKAALQYRS